MKYNSRETTFVPVRRPLMNSDGRSSLRWVRRKLREIGQGYKPKPYLGHKVRMGKTLSRVRHPVSRLWWMRLMIKTRDFTYKRREWRYKRRKV